MACLPSATSRHSPSGSRTPPGKRQLIATIAMGSRLSCSISRSRCLAPWRSAVTRRRYSRSRCSSATSSHLPRGSETFVDQREQLVGAGCLDAAGAAAVLSPPAGEHPVEPVRDDGPGLLVGVEL